MGKVLAFKRVTQEVKKVNETEVETSHIDDEISAILNDHSLTAANRHWLLENLLMNIDEQLEGYKNELEMAERKLDALVQSAEADIEAAFRDFETHVLGMTKAVRKLTRSSSGHGGPGTAGSATGGSDS